jgi:hypothetical protein
VQVENCIKPYKYEVEVDDREWGLGREHAEQAFIQEIKRCEMKLGEIRDKVGGGRRLNGLVGYVSEVERAEEDRRMRRMSGEVGEEETGPMDVYKYSPAQVVDGMSLIMAHESWLMYQADTLYYSRIDYHSSSFELRL